MFSVHNIFSTKYFQYKIFSVPQKKLQFNIEFTISHHCSELPVLDGISTFKFFVNHRIQIQKNVVRILCGPGYHETCKPLFRKTRMLLLTLYCLRCIQYYNKYSFY